MAAPIYRAFISYSHADAAVAKWLHRVLEAYRVPAKLVGRDTPLGPVPRRLLPIFKDREELAASGTLSDGLRNSLAAAQSLIVIASPDAARSRWVNEEVRAYKQIHGEAQVLVVIASGEPGASAMPGREAEECFPPAVRFCVGADGAIGNEAAEPIAADLRDHGDGRRLAKLKLVAGLTGLRLDDLVQREAQRRAQRMRWITIVATLVALIMLVLTVIAVRARAEADRQRAQADGLVEFMLTDLRKKLEPVGRLDALDVVGQRALTYYAAQQPGSLDADSLGRRSRALHLVGEVRNLRGNSDGALAAFRQAEATTAELMARSPNDGHRVFDQAQSVFWVGLVAYQRGLTGEAERNFREYKRLADKLVAIDPNNADWRMEVGYAQSNLGTLLIDRGRFPEAEQAFREYLRVDEADLARKPNEPAALIEVGQALSWLGRALGDQDKSAQAVVTYQREIGFYREALAHDPRNNVARQAMVVAQSSIGWRELSRGNLLAALDAFHAATDMGAALLALEPTNGLWRVMWIKAQFGVAETSLYAGNLTASATAHRAAQDALDRLKASDRKNVEWNVAKQGRLDDIGAAIADASGATDEAHRLAMRGAALLAPIVKVNDEDNSYVLAHLSLILGDLSAKRGWLEDARVQWRRAAALIGSAGADRSSLKLAARYAADRRLGRTAEARSIAALLDQRGFRHPVYLRERNR